MSLKITEEKPVWCLRRIYPALILPALILPALFLWATPEAFCSAFDEGVKAYNGHKYQVAVKKFGEAYRASPTNSTCLYYLAIAYQALGDLNNARSCYQQILTRFPGTEASKLAGQALGVALPGGAQTQTSTAGAGDWTKVLPGANGQTQPAGNAPQFESRGAGGQRQNNGLSSVPEHARVYFKKDGDALLVDAQVNGRPLAMEFDTGAPMCNLGLNHLRDLGLPPPTGPARVGLSGVGAQKTTRTWITNMDIKVGSIERHGVAVRIDEFLPSRPLLGQTFFGDLKYTIDYGASAIDFSRLGRGQAQASAGGQSQDRNSVPFTREGMYIIVSAQVNGRSCKMIFDTGNSAASVSFTRDQLARLGVSVPEDAQRTMNLGTGGVTGASVMSLDRVRLGPVDKQSVQISVPDSSNAPYPLLGEGFYNDWQYEIDEGQHLIHFLRR